MELPSISIVTPTLNQAAYIEETIDSVLSQAYPRLEYIVMDGGSTDETVEILKRHEKHLTWFSQKDRGQSDALNRGFKMATGEVLAYLNSDDIYEAGALHRVGAFFASHPQAYWVTGKCRVINAGGQECRSWITRYKNLWLPLRSYEILKILNFISQPATFLKQEVLDRVGYLDETLRWTMDYDLWMRIGKHYRLCFINEYLADFRMHTSSISGSTANKQFDEQYQVVRRYVKNSTLLFIHRLHNFLSSKVYWILLHSLRD